MKLIRHAVVSLVIFAMLMTLSVSVYNGLEDNYGFTPDTEAEINGYKNIGTALQELGVITGLNQTVSGIASIKEPSSGIDILGKLATVAVGILKTAWGLLIFPAQIMDLISEYYMIPPIITTGFIMIIIIYFGFILLSAYLRSDV